LTEKTLFFEPLVVDRKTLFQNPEKGGNNFDPTPILSEMAEFLEKESDVYISKDPDPFEDRHPSR
jgi:HIV-1 Vpr-binding protein